MKRSTQEYIEKLEKEKERLTEQFSKTVEEKEKQIEDLLLQISNLERDRKKESGEVIQDYQDTALEISSEAKIYHENQTQMEQTEKIMENEETGLEEIYRMLKEQKEENQKLASIILNEQKTIRKQQEQINLLLGYRSPQPERDETPEEEVKTAPEELSFAKTSFAPVFTKTVQGMKEKKEECLEALSNIKKSASAWKEELNAGKENAFGRAKERLQNIKVNHYINQLDRDNWLLNSQTRQYSTLQKMERYFDNVKYTGQNFLRSLAGRESRTRAESKKSRIMNPFLETVASQHAMNVAYSFRDFSKLSELYLELKDHNPALFEEKKEDMAAALQKAQCNTYFALVSGRYTKEEVNNLYAGYDDRKNITAEMIAEHYRISKNPFNQEIQKEANAEVFLSYQMMNRINALEMEDEIDLSQFNEEQKREIREGLDLNLDVTYYLDPGFSAIEMSEIKDGLKKCLPVAVYADHGFKHDQMRQIKMGLEEGMDASLYASPEKTADEMAAMRKSLSRAYKNLDHAELTQMNQEYNMFQKEQLQQALEKGVDLSLLANVNYDSTQMREIRTAAEHGLTKEQITLFADPDMNSRQMLQIRIGLEKNLDVSSYADKKYNSKQMEQIRKGLESGLDISAYNSTWFSGGQMKEIRMGLESGLDVSTFADPKLSAEKMETAREAMLKNEPEGAVENKVEESEPEQMEEPERKTEEDREEEMEDR